ncbi:hypothetical protein SAMN05444396_10442 [Flavobacterium segetis]|uniref:Uncharacterized protein n=1 Tax=Flavobacterium segetis TaxID=271157 RepID=A0A1M5GN80_9FLAO|nr:hypothetical protein SAMN05444396_10442 [Flavobacterium segetis]
MFYLFIISGDLIQEHNKLLLRYKSFFNLSQLFINLVV